MSRRYVVEALLRPAVELNTSVVSAVAAFVCIRAPWAIALAPSVSYVMAGGFAVLAIIRTWQGIDGLEKAPQAFIDLLNARHFGKQIVKINWDLH